MGKKNNRRRLIEENKSGKNMTYDDESLSYDVEGFFFFFFPCILLGSLLLLFFF